MRPIPLLAVTFGLVIGSVLPFIVSSLGSGPRAGTALRMGLEEVFERSDLVIEGRVRAGMSGRAANGVIYTDWEIDVTRTFWGEDRPTRIVRIPGGILPSGDGMLIPGLPRLIEGEDVVLLLGAESSTGLRMPTGLSQGKYRIVVSTAGDRSAIQTGEHVTLLTTQRARRAEGQQVLDRAELVARLEAAGQARAARMESGRPPVFTRRPVSTSPAERSDADTASDDR